MFLDIEWYWWLVILVVVLVSLPLKVKYIKWWNKRKMSKKSMKKGKWGEEDD